MKNLKNEKIWKKYSGKDEYSFEMFICMCAGSFYAFPDCIVDALEEKLNETNDHVVDWAMIDEEYYVKTQNGNIIYLNWLI